MKRTKLAQAMDQISDSYIADAAQKRAKRRLPWLGAAAAVLAVVLLLRFVEFPMAIRAQAVSTASAPRITGRPDLDDYGTREAWLSDLERWDSQRAQRQDTAAQSMEQMDDFLQRSCQEFLNGSEENRLYSPINAYIGLAMAAELTAGQTQAQLLAALGAESTEALRLSVSALWEQVYRDNGKEICTLANSLWLDDSTKFHQPPMDILARDYYASVYRQDLSSDRALRDIQAWLNNNTGGFLKDSVQNVQLPREAVLALYSTIYFQSKWTDEFNAANNTKDTFHSTGGDLSCTFMNKKRSQMHYYWGESFGAVSLHLKNGSQMWFFLPDPDKTTDQVLAEGEYLKLLTDNSEENRKYMMVNLSVPKFDIQGTQDLREGLEQLGITDLFDLEKADFSTSMEGPAFITAANQSVRVAVDEQGVTAAAYLELPGAGAAAPPEEIIDFVLDRPFLFVITGSGGIPLFAGTVNQP